MKTTFNAIKKIKIMKYIKLYEDYDPNSHPTEGDFIITKYIKDERLNDFLINHIGRITEVLVDEYFDGLPALEYRVKYDDATKEIEAEIADTHGYDDYNVGVWEEDIEHYSKNKDDLELILKNR